MLGESGGGIVWRSGWVPNSLVVQPGHEGDMALLKSSPKSQTDTMVTTNKLPHF